MSPELASSLQAIAGIATLMVAVISIVIALRTEKRSHDRFLTELNLSRDLAAASVRPLLSVVSVVAGEEREVCIVNRGIGPAVVTSFVMKRGDKSVQNMKDLFDIGNGRLWTNWRRLPREKFVLSPGQEIVLVRLTKEYLVTHGITEEAADTFLDSWTQQKTGIEVCFNYEDALGTVQDAFTKTLR